MKILICLLLMTGIAQASWYVVNIDNQVVAKCEYQPDSKDLDSRNEIAVFSKKDISLGDAEYRGGKIVKHIKTSAEKKAEQELAEKRAEKKMINEKMRELAIQELTKEGVQLKYSKCKNCTK